MCEPNHSIVQYPTGDDDDDRGTPTASSERIEAAVSKNRLASWGKKIREFFHFSTFGAGHSGATGFGYHEERWLPSPTSYEAMWWVRKVSFDGEFRGRSFNKDEALSAATEYANRTSIGSLSIFRKFFELSLKQTYKPNAYIDIFLMHLLNKEGRAAVDEKLWKAFRLRSIPKFGYSLFGVPKNRSVSVENFVKFLLGFTRKRNLLVPEWADDDKLWLPSTT